jgi:hypothetical protein
MFWRIDTTVQDCNHLKESFTPIVLPQCLVSEIVGAWYTVAMWPFILIWEAIIVKSCVCTLLSY